MQSAVWMMRSPSETIGESSKPGHTCAHIKALYADELQKTRMLTASVREYEDILRLNEADNMGIRYILMGIYCQLEQMEKAKELYQRSPEASAQMLLPLILLSLKYDDELSAKRYYKDQKENKSCKSFWRPGV